MRYHQKEILYLFALTFGGATMTVSADPPPYPQERAVVFVVSSDQPYTIQEFGSLVETALPDCKPTPVPKWHHWEPHGPDHANSVAYMCPNVTQQTFAAFGKIFLNFQNAPTNDLAAKGTKSELLLSATYTCTYYVCPTTGVRSRYRTDIPCGKC